MGWKIEIQEQKTVSHMNDATMKLTQILLINELYFCYDQFNLSKSSYAVSINV